MEIKVTKNWENMNASSIFPNVKLILHQVMFATTMNDEGTDYIRDTNGNPILTPVEYATYEKLLRKDEESTHHWTYTFGENVIDGSNVKITSDKFIKEEGSTTKSATVKFSGLPSGEYTVEAGNTDVQTIIVPVNQTTSPNNTVSVQFTLSMPKTSMADKHIKLQRNVSDTWTDVTTEKSGKNIQAYINNSTSFENVVEDDEIVIKNNSFVVSGDQKQATVKLTNLTSGEYRIVVTGDSGSAVASSCTYDSENSNVTFTVERNSTDNGDQYVTLQRLDNNNNKWEAVTKDNNNNDIQVSFNFGSAESALVDSEIVIPDSKFELNDTKEKVSLSISNLPEGSYRAVLGKNVYTQELDETAEKTVEVNVTVKIPADNGDEQYIKLKCGDKDVIYDQNKEKIKASFNNDPDAVEVLEVLSSRKNPKEDIRQYAPDGSYFGYYITEVLSNYEGESIELNAMDVSNASQFLGDFYNKGEISTKGISVYDKDTKTWITKTVVSESEYANPMPVGKTDKDYIVIRDDGYGFRVTKLEQPARLSDDNTEEQYSEMRSQEPILRDAEITNTYEPDIDKFYGNLVVNKTWDDKDDSAEGQNALNTGDFNAANDSTKNAHDYTFTVSRKTPRLPSKELFEIKTWDITVDPPRPTVGVLDETGTFIINLDNPMKRYDSHGQPIADNDTTAEVSYYAKTIDFTKYVYTNLTNEIKVTVKVYKTPGENYNKVEISGLAIYGQDAVKYTYKITETETVSKQTKETVDTGDKEAYTFTQPDGQKMDGNKNTAEFDLKNTLKVFTLNLNKVFGKRFTKQDGNSNNETATVEISNLHNDNYRVLSDSSDVIISDVTSIDKLSFKATRPKTANGNQIVTIQKYENGSWVDVNGYEQYTIAENQFASSTESTAILPTEDYEQYFNDAYVNNLRFILERRKSNETEYTRYDYTDTTINGHVFVVDGHKQYSVIKGTDSNNLPYYRLQFKNLPKYSADGYVYYYRVTELEPSDTSNKHYTTTYTAASSQYGGSTPVAVYCDSDTDESRDTYVRNNFESKQITVNKYWNDEKNADGLRPDNLKVTIKESIGETNPTTVNINKVLTDKNRWTMLVELPKYYYNGYSPTGNLKYGISETMQVTAAENKVSAYDLTANGYSLEENGYESKSDGEPTKHKFTNTDDLKNIEDNDFYSLYLQNKQDKRVNSKLTFEKSWQDYNNKWSTRSDNIYVKVLRMAKVPIMPDKDKIITVSGDKAYGQNLMVTIFNLPNGNIENEYRIVRYSREAREAVENTNPVEYEDVWTPVPVTESEYLEDAKKLKKVIITISGVSAADNVKFKLQRKSSADGDYADMDTDEIGNTIQAFAGDGSGSNEVVTTDNQNHTLTAKTEDENTTYTADSVTGVFTIPVSTSKVIFQNLDYGTTSNTAGDQNNGTWSQYYYTVVECDPNGNDFTTDWVTTSTETGSEKEFIAQDVSFTITLNNFAENKTYLNLRVNKTDSTEGVDIAQKDIDGNPICAVVELGNEEYGASSSNIDPNTNIEQENILAKGVIVIPIPENLRDPVTRKATGKIEGTIKGLPYGTYSSGTWTRYNYKVQRSKASGKYHDLQDTAANGTNGLCISTTSTDVKAPKKTNVEVTREWPQDAVNYRLRPSMVYYKLYRITDADDAPELVTSVGSNGLVTGNVSLNKYDDNHANLDNGKIVTDINGNYVWKTYNYYVEEYKSDGTTKIAQSSIPYTQTQTNGVEKPFQIKQVSNVYSEAELSEGIRNDLKERKYAITKKWDDSNNEYDSRDVINLKLEYKSVDPEKGAVKTWTNVPVGSSNAAQKFTWSGSEYGDPTDITITANPFSISGDDLKTNQVKIELSGLPRYDKNGVELEYKVSETSIGSKTVESGRKYLFQIPTPSFKPPTESGKDEWESSYVTKYHDGVNNYYVDYKVKTESENEGVEETEVTNKIVTNAVSYVHVSAKKTWADENNIYGKRPKTITYKLKRTKCTVTLTKDEHDNYTITKTDPVVDGTFVREKTVGESENWSVAWGNCALYDKTETDATTYTEYEYYVVEDPTPADYNQSHVDALTSEAGGDLTRAYTFTNTYLPKKKSLTATKEWDDMKNKYQLRPDSILFELRCRFEQFNYTTETGFDLVPNTTVPVYDGPVYNSAVYESFTTDQKNAFDSADGTKDGKFKLTKDGYANGNTVDTSGAKDKWQISFSDLPAYINTAGTAVKNGKSVPVTYYIREYLPRTDGTTGYVDTTISDYKEYYELSNYPYKPSDDINADKTATHVIPVMIDNLPKTDGAKDYDYELYNGSTKVTLTDIQTFGDTVTIYANVSTAAGADNTVLKVKRRPKGSEDSVAWNVVTKDKANSTLKAVIGYTMLVDGDSDNDSTVEPVEIIGNAQNGEITILNTKPVENSPTSRGVFLLNNTGATAPDLLISNTLNTRDIVVRKVWNDNGVQKDSEDDDIRKFHYDIDVTLSSEQFNCTDAGRSDGSHYSETKAIPKDYDPDNKGKPATDFANAVIFRDLPKYKKDGSLITYEVTETVADVTVSGETKSLTNLKTSDLRIENGTEPSLTYTTTTTPATTSTLGVVSNSNSTDLTLADADHKYGYTATWESYKSNADSADNAVVRFKITNELPIATFNVDVYWNDYNNRDGRRPENVQAVLTRKDYKSRPVSDVTGLSGGKTVYQTDGRKIYFDSTLTWTDPIIIFMNNEGTVIHDSTGYPVKTDGGKMYIEVPTDAKKFVLKGTNAVESVVTVLTPGSTYSVSDEKQEEKYKLTSNGVYESALISAETVGVTSAVFGENDKIDTVDKKSWHFDFGRHPVYGEDNNPFTYSISEYSTTTGELDTKKYTYDYSRSITMNDSEVIHTSSTSGYKDYESPNEMEDDKVITSKSSETQNTSITSVNFSIRNNYTPETGKIKIEKTWAGDDAFKDTTRPTGITYKLYCKNADNQKVPVTDSSVSSWFSGYTVSSEYTVTAGTSTTNVWEYNISGLPVYKNPTGTEITAGSSGKITYYLEEAVPTAYKLTSSHNGVEFTLPDQTLQVEEEIQRAYTNTLKTRDIPVTKTWVDHNCEGASSLHYAVDVTLANTDLSCTANGKHDESGKYKETQTIVANSDTPAKFEGLPIYDSSGNVLTYTIAETANGVTSDHTSTTMVNNDTTASGYYYLTVTNHKYGYIGSCTYTKTSESGINKDYATSFTITNELPVVKFTAQKVWSDDNNRDYKRPENLTFTLKRDGDSSFSETGTATQTAWNTNFNNKVFPKYKEDDTEYSYVIAEEAIPEYTNSNSTNTYVNSTTSGNITTNNYRFENTKNTTYKGNVKATKVWVGDDDHKTYTRPDSVTVQLWCSYDADGGRTPVYAAEAAYVTSYSGAPAANGGYEQTLSESNNWTYTFENLPMYTNPTGNGTERGVSYQIHYYIQELNTGTGGLKGYNTTYGSGTETDYSKVSTVISSNGAAPELTVKNTLITQPVTVNKEWSKNCPETLTNAQYDAKIKISSTDINSYNVTKTTSNNTATFTGLPLYYKNGTAATYTIEELDTSNGGVQKYHYNPGYSVTNGQFTLKDADATNGVNTIIVTNTLPTTSLTIEKNWVDKFGTLDYSDFRQTVTFVVQRSADNGTTWTVLTDTAVYPIVENRRPDANNPNKWTYTISHLLQYDEQNRLYKYRVKENPVKAYYRSVPADSDTITEENATTDAHCFSFTNTLITRDITVEKEWDDSGYKPAADENLHYAVGITLESESGTNLPNDTKLTYSQQTIAADNTNKNGGINSGGSTTFSNIPVCDKAGNIINYSVAESGQEYGYYLVSGYPTSTNGTVTCNSTNYTCVTSFKFQNKLPVTYLKVNKIYSDNEDYHKYATDDGRKIYLDLTRSYKVNDVVTADTDFDNATDNKNIEVSYAVSGISWQTPSPVLVYDDQNRQYTYKVSEHDVKGYTTAYSYSYTDGDPAETKDGTIPAKTATSGSPLELTITNTAITGAASVVKIDKTFYDKYHTHSDYKDITIAGAKFELYIKTGTEQSTTYTPVYVKKNDNGKYTIDDSNEANKSNIVVSANSDSGDIEKGEIEFEGMPLNTYYLKETYVNDAYVIRKNGGSSDVYYEFTIDVNDASSTTADKVTYTAETDTAVGFIGKEGTTQNKIGNPEVVHQTTATLTKVDAQTNTAITDSKATYYLLERIPYSVRKEGTVGDNESAYNDMSLKVIKGDTAVNPVITDCGGKYTDAVALYWNKVGEYQTNDNGKIEIPANTLSFHTYTFLEVQAPVGYERSYGGFTVKNANNEESNSMTFTISSTNYSCTITHADPRRDANVKIYKQDEYENPLNGATFDLYYMPNDTGVSTPTNSQSAIHIATVVTGDDGLPETVTIINDTYAESADDEVGNGKSVKVKNWGTYYWKEVKRPTGYTEKNGTILPSFTIGANEADKVVNVYKADNERIKGKVTLTKLAQEKVGDINIGKGVPGATFELHKQSDAAVVKISVDNASESVYNVDSSGTATLTTDDNGQFTIQNLDWGQYYLQEVSAPTGFAVNPDKIYFTVGRNNCGDTPQELTIKDPAAKAKIKLTKTINDRVEAWGDPTFIFKIRQTKSLVGDTSTDISEHDQPVKIISLTLTSEDKNNGKEKSTDYFDVAPGTYEITEISVARYEFASGTVSVNNGDAVSFNNGTATFTVAANGIANISYVNNVKYYDKFSHVNCEVNKFHGYKGIRVEYNKAIPVGTDPATISKTELDVYKIMSNGKEVKLDSNDSIDAAFMNGIKYTYVEKPGDDIRFGKNETHDFSSDDTKISITNPSRYTDSVYTLKATDTNNNSGFECTFDISFVSKNQQPKAYEKTVVFKADNENKSFFYDEGVRTSQYALTFTMVKNSSDQYEVYCVKHNGKVIAQGSGFETQVNDAISALTTGNSPVLTVNEAYAYNETSNPTGLVFDKWNDGTDHEGVQYTDFASKVTNGNASETITYTAKLKKQT